MSLKPGGLYRVASGTTAGALVRFHFMNVSGNADCRFAEDFGPFREGWITVVRPDNLAPIPEEQPPCVNATN